MKDSDLEWNRRWRRLAVVGVLVAISGANGVVGAGEGTAPMALRGVMRELGEQMQAATDGISREDY